MSEMNISVLEAQVAAAGTTVFEIPVRQYPAVETRVFIDVRMVCRTVGMSVNNDFGSILSHGTGDVIDDDIHDFLAFFLVVIGALIAQASGQSDTVFKFFTEDLTLDIGGCAGSHGTADIQDQACTTYRRGTKGYDQIRLEPESGLQ